MKTELSKLKTSLEVSIDSFGYSVYLDARVRLGEKVIMVGGLEDRMINGLSWPTLVLYPIGDIKDNNSDTRPYKYELTCKILRSDSPLLK